jgi:hypothetical protein
MKCAIIAIIAAATLCSAAPARAQETLAEKVKRLEAEVAVLQRRVVELEAELAEKAKPKRQLTVEVRGDKATEPDGLVLNQPLDDEQRAAVAKATETVSRLASELQKHGGNVSTSPNLSRNAVVKRWAEASKKLVELYAEYGQESACLTMLARFHAWKNKSYDSQGTFDAAAHNCAKTFAGPWKKPESAMRIAARYGPKSTTKGVAWGRLCESAARATGKRAYKALALKCYLRAAVAGNERGAWQSVRRLEAELKTQR